MEMKQFAERYSPIWFKRRQQQLKFWFARSQFRRRFTQRTSVLRFSRPQSTENGSDLATIASKQADRSSCRPRGPLDRARRKLDVRPRSQISFRSATAAQQAPAVRASTPKE